MHHTTRPLALSLLLVCVLLLPGCGLFRGTGGDFTVRSNSSAREVRPDIVTAAYHRLDDNTADVYLSDLPQDRFLNPRDDLADASGSLVHVHIFLVPRAGSTPIDDTACNVTLHHAVLAGGGQVGVYGGGGFFLLRDDIGDAALGGTLTEASHRLLRATPGFNDLLGPAEMTGRFSAARNEALARAMAGKLDALMRRAPEVAPD